MVMLHALRSIHRWIGLAIALPVALVAVSGSLLVFRDAYYRARWPIVARDITAVDLARQPEILEQIEKTFGAERIATVKFPREGVHAFHVYLADRGEALVDPSTGAIVARWDARSDPAAFLFDLHAHLLAGARGEVINGYLALVLCFLGLSGLLLWWPRRATTFHLRHVVPRGTSGAALLRSHAASGAVLLAGVLLFSATGAGLVFYEAIGGAMSAAFDGAEPMQPSAAIAPSDTARAPWSEILAAARTALPEAGPRMYYPGPADNPVLTFRKALPGEWHPNGRSYVLVDPYTAAVVQTIDARAQGAGTRLMHAIYPVHAAMVGGASLAVVAVLSGVGLAWLAIGGSWTYLVRLLRLRRQGAAAAREAAGSTVGYARASGDAADRGLPALVRTRRSSGAGARRQGGAR